MSTHLWPAIGSMYKVLIIDDHALVRDGMRLLLQGLDSALQTFEAGSCEEGLGLLPAIAPLDLVLLDLGLPGTGGLAGIPLFLRRAPDTPIVVFSASENAHDARAVLDAGARGFVSKSASSDVLVGAIRRVLSGGVYIPPDMVLPEPEATAPALRNKAAQLTPRQIEVLKLLARGKTNKVIARTLDMAESTVRVHTTAIFRVLEVGNRTEAAFAATRLGLLPASSSDVAHVADSVPE